MKHHGGLWIIVALVGILALWLLSAYWQFLAFAIIFALLCYPVYEFLQVRTNRNIAAFAVTIGVLILLVVPSMYLAARAVQQVPAVYAQVLSAMQDEQVVRWFGVSSNEVLRFATEIGNNLRTNFFDNITALFGRISTIALGLFLMFVTLFFLLRDGRVAHKLLVEAIPVRRSVAESFLRRLRNVTFGVLLGQLVTALAQGLLAGLFFFALGIENALLLGLVTAFLSIIPVLGPFIVYVPVAGVLFVQGHPIMAIIVFGFGTLVLSQMDNVIRPYIAARTAKVHPLISIIGAIAGLTLWGVIGFVLGPLVFAAFLALWEFIVTGDEKALAEKK